MDGREEGRRPREGDLVGVSGSLGLRPNLIPLLKRLCVRFLASPLREAASLAAEERGGGEDQADELDEGGRGGSG